MNIINQLFNEAEVTESLWKIKFTTRISGISKVRYSTRYMVIEAPTRKEAEDAFESLIRRVTFTTAVMGFELGKYYKATKVSREEAENIPVSNSAQDGKDRKQVYSLADIKKMADEWKERDKELKARWK